MTDHFLAHMGSTESQERGHLYPSPVVEETECIGPFAAHRSRPNHAVIERVLDGRKVPNTGVRRDWNNQDAYINFLKRHPVAVDDSFILIGIPWKTRFTHLYWCVFNPVPGVSVDIVSHFDGTVLQSLNAGDEQSGFIAIPEDKQWRHDTNEFIKLMFTALPVEPAEGWGCDGDPMRDLGIRIGAEVICPYSGK